MRLTPFQNANLIDKPKVWINPAFVMAVVPGDFTRPNDKPSPERTSIVMANGLVYFVVGIPSEVRDQLLKE